MYAFVNLLHTRCTNVCYLHLQSQHTAVQAELEAVRRECTTLAAAAEEAAELKERLSAARSAAAAAKQTAQKEAFQLQAQVTPAAFLCGEVRMREIPSSMRSAYSIHVLSARQSSMKPYESL
jgi:hypothetical protein